MNFVYANKLGFKGGTYDTDDGYVPYVNNTKLFVLVTVMAIGVLGYIRIAGPSAYSYTVPSFSISSQPSAQANQAIDNAASPNSSNSNDISASNWQNANTRQQIAALNSTAATGLQNPGSATSQSANSTPSQNIIEPNDTINTPSLPTVEIPQSDALQPSEPVLSIDPPTINVDPIVNIDLPTVNL